MKCNKEKKIESLQIFLLSSPFFFILKQLFAQNSIIIHKDF